MTNENAEKLNSRLTSCMAQDFLWAADRCSADHEIPLSTR